LEPLVRALAYGDDTPQVAGILGKLKDPRALPALRKELACYETDNKTRQVLQQAIAAINAR